jgi:hypothetical protein
MIYHLGLSLASSVHPGGLRHADILPPLPTYISVSGMDLGCEGDIDVYVFAPYYAELIEGHQIRPIGLVTMIRQVPAPVRAGAGSYGSGSACNECESETLRPGPG